MNRGCEMKVSRSTELGSYFSFPENIKSESDGLRERITQQIAVKMVDNYESAVVEEIAMSARAEGITDCAVLNKQAIIDALKKAVPTKPNNSETRAPLCPFCNRFIDRKEHKHGNIDIPHCKWCGQALNWEG